MQRILCVHLPNWSIQRRMVAAGSRVAWVLTVRDSRRGPQVVACSSNAYQQGVRVGMPLAEAKSLACQPTDRSQSSRQSVTPSPRHPATHAPRHSATHAPRHPLTFEEHDPQADRTGLEGLAQWCEQFSPLVGLEAADEPSSLLLEVTGLAVLFGSEEALAQRVVVAFQQRGYSVRVAIADCIGAAWAVTHFAALSHPAAPSPCHPATPSPWHLIPPGADCARLALAPLPLAALRLTDQTISLLHDLGVTRIEQLLQLPRASLAARFGDSLARRLDQAFGSLSEIIVAHRAPPGFHVEWPLEHPTYRRDVIAQILLQLVERVALRLEAQDLGVLELTCRLHSGRDQTAPVCLQIALFQPTSKASHLGELVQLQLERLTFSGQVASVSVEATTTAPLEIRQRELFADSYSQSRSQLAILANRLGSRLGEKRVKRACLRAGAQPERAVRYLSLASGKEKRPSRSKADVSKAIATARPLKLFSPPVKLSLLAVAPDGPPVRFRYEREQHHIARHWGPERIETGWWRGRSVRRDYYRVETRSGHRFWLYRQLDNGQWFLQGAFE